MDVLSKNLERILGKHNSENSLPMFSLKDLTWYHFIVYVTYCIGFCICGRTLSKPPLHKGGMRFSKNDCNGGGGGLKSLLEMGGEAGMRGGGGVVMGGWEIFQVSLAFLS